MISPRGCEDSHRPNQNSETVADSNDEHRQHYRESGWQHRFRPAVESITCLARIDRANS